jgi:type II secretory pathway pseudopilin PulG
MNTITTLLASLAIAGITMAAVGPNYTVNSRGADETRLTEYGRTMDAVGVVAYKVKDQTWLMYGNGGDYVLYFSNEANLCRGMRLHVWGGLDGYCDVFGENVPCVQVVGYEVK